MRKLTLFASLLICCALPASAQQVNVNMLANGSASLLGATASVGGSLLSGATCTSGTATVTGATTAMVAVASPVTYPGDGIQWQAYVSGANTVTVKVCALALLTPSASIYNVRVLP